MTFWNGTRWVADPAIAPPTPARHPGDRRRLRFFGIAVGVLLLLPAMAWTTPGTTAGSDLTASGPVVTFTGVGVPGHLLVMDGRGFKAHTVYQVHWDTVPSAIRLVWPDAVGTFHGHLRVPTAATDGSHVATFAPVDRAQATRVAQGSLAISAITPTGSIAQTAVQVSSLGRAVDGVAASGREPAPAPTTAPLARKVARFGATGTQAQFLTLMKDMTVDVIEIQAGTYRGWHLWFSVDRSARPLTIRPAAGATVTFDDAGEGSGDGLFYAGWSGHTADVSFQGPFHVTNYLLGQTGLVNTAWVSNVTFNDFRVSGVTAPTTSGQSAFVVYVSSDGTHRGANLTFNDWTVDSSLSGHKVSGLQLYHTPQASGVTALRWTMTGGYWGFVGRGDATGVDVEGWRITDAVVSFDSQGPAGIVNGMVASSSGAPIIRSPMVDVGGNSWTGTPVPTPTPTPTPAATPAATPTTDPTATPTPTPTPTSTPTPTPTLTPTTAPAGQNVVPFAASGSPSQFLSLMRDMSVDVIEMQGGTYSRWNLVVNVDRTARPLLIRPAPGATVIFDGSGGTGGGGVFEIGSSYSGGNYYASNITFDGSSGIFRIQNYSVSATGLVWMQYVRNITMSHFQVRNITGAAGGMTSHVVYVSTDGIHPPTNLTFNDWDVQLTGQLVSGLQIYHTPAPAQGVTALRWTISGCHWGFVGRYAVTGVDIEGWTISNCAIAFDSQGPAGIVRNMHATTSGAPTISLPMVNGGGNVWQ